MSFSRRLLLFLVGAGLLLPTAGAAQRAELPAPAYADVAYGPHPRNVLDFWPAPGQKVAPVIVFIHGGGFVGGNKRAFPPQMLQGAHAAGIHFAAIHYRFVGNGITFPAPQLDGARAIQFLRHKAAEWKIEPTRIAAYGGSAGAGISMWLGYHDDLRKPDSADPVERQSTRVRVVGSIGGQCTYDPIKIKELVGGRAWEHPSIFKVYGVTTAEEALKPTPAMQRLYDEASAITHLTRGDAPTFMLFSEPDADLPPDARPGQGIHHPRFAHHLRAKLDALGIPWAYRHTSDGKGGNPQRELLDFLIKHLTGD